MRDFATASAIILTLTLSRYIARRCRELRWFAEQGWAEPKPKD